MTAAAAAGVHVKHNGAKGVWSGVVTRKWPICMTEHRFALLIYLCLLCIGANIHVHATESKHIVLSETDKIKVAGQQACQNSNNS